MRTLEDLKANLVPGQRFTTISREDAPIEREYVVDQIVAGGFYYRDVDNPSSYRHGLAWNFSRRWVVEGNRATCQSATGHVGFIVLLPIEADGEIAHVR